MSMSAEHQSQPEAAQHADENAMAIDGDALGTLSEAKTLENGDLPEASQTSPENAEKTETQENGTAAKDEPEPVDLERARAEFQQQARTYLIEQSRHVVIPSFAKWFDLNEIHSIEKKLFPDFFPAASATPEDGAQPVPPLSVYKTVETYRNMRDFMVNTYRINPVEYLTVTAVRRNLAGDVASIIRIHRFLERWGLINYQIDPRTKPSLVGPQYTGHFQITLDTPKGLTPFVPEEITLATSSASGPGPESGPESVRSAGSSAIETEATSSLVNGDSRVADIKAEPSGESVIPLNVDVTRNIFTETKTTKAPASVTYLCNETANDVSDVRYHNLKSKATIGGNMGPLVISKECYEQGLFPLNFSASDFLKLEKTSKQSEWSKQEVLLLLEGIEMFGSIESNPQSLFVNSNGQWDKISDHVSTKSREECLIKFLHLPIEDRYLQKLVRDEEKEELDLSFNKDTIIQEVISKLIETPKGQEVIAENSRKNLQQSVVEQSNLVNQVVELTLEKFEAKMKHINQLETNLAKTENLLNLQRKQVLVERWMNFEKLSQFRNTNTNPELAPLLDDLLTPVSLGEINEKLSRIEIDAAGETQISHPTEESNEDELPVSLTQPKAYLFWSA